MSKKVRKVSRIDDPNIEAQIDEIIRVVNSLDARTEDADTKATVNTQPSLVFREFPSDPVFGNCEFVYDVTLRWYKAEGAIMYEIRTDLNWGNESGRVYLGSALQYSFTPGQRHYTFYIKSINPAGKYSQGYDEIILEKPVPSIPDPPETMPFFSAVKIIPAPNHEQGILGHYAYVTIEGETDKVDIPIGSSHAYNAPSGTEMTIEMSAYDILGEGGKSAPVTASTLKLSDRDIPEEIIKPSNLVKSLREDIDLTKTNAIDALTQISDLDSIVDDTIADLNAAKGRLTSAETEINNAKNKISTVETKIGEAETKIADIDDEIEAAKGRLTSAETEISNAKNRISTVEIKIGEAETKIADIDDEIEAAIEAANDRLTSAETEIAGAKNRLDSVETEVAGAKSRLSDAEDKLGTIDVEIAEAKDRISDTEADLLDAKNRLSDVEDEIVDTKDRLLDAESRLSSAEGSISDAENRLSSIDDEIADAKNRLLGAESRLSSIDDEIADAKDRLTDAESRLTATETDLTDAKTKLTSVEESITDAEARLVDAENRLSSIDDEIADAKDRLTDAELRLTAAETDLTDARTRLIEAENDLEGLEGVVSTHETKISNVEGELSTKVSQTEFNALAGTVSTQGTILAQHADQIAMKAEQSEVDTLSEAVANNTATLEVHATQIAARVTKEVYNLLENRVEEAESELVALADEISAKVSQTVFEDLQSRVTANEAELLVQAEAIQARVTQEVYDTLANRVTTVEGTLEVLPEQIALKASQSDVDALTGRVEDAEAELLVLATEISSKVSQTVFDTLSEAVTSQGTQITQNAAAIESKADQSVVDALSGTVAEHSTLISQTAEAIETKADKSVVDTLSDTVSSHTSTLQQHANMIAARVTTEVFNALEDRVEANEAELIVLADEISSKVSQSVFDALEQRVTTNEGTLAVHADMIAARVTSEVFDLLEERVETAEGQLTVLADEVSAKVSQTVFDALAGRVETTEGILEVLPDQINAKADQSVVDTLTERVEEAEGQLSVLATEIAARVTQTVFDELEGRVASNEGELTVLADEISSKVSQSVFDTLAGRVSEAEGQLTVLAGEIEARVKQSVFDELVGRVEDAEATLTVLPGQIAAKADKTTVQQIDDELNTVKSNVATLTTNYDGIVARVEEVEGDINSLDDEITDVKSRTGQLEVRAGKIEASVSAIEEDVDDHGNRLVSVEHAVVEVLPGQIALKADQSEVDILTGRVEDTEATLVVLATEISSKVSQTVFDTLSETVTSQGTQITQNATAIESKADQSVVDTLSGTVSNHSTLISQNATAITQKADKSTVNALTGRVSAAEATLTTHAEEIEARATKEEVDAIEDRVTAAEGQLSVQAGKIEAKAEKSEVQALEEDLSAVSTQVGVLTTSYDSISARVEAVEGVTDDLTGEVSSVKNRTGQLEVRAGNIEASVSEIEEEIDEHGARLTTAEANIIAQAGEIALKAEKTEVYTKAETDEKIDGIEIGGRNLVVRYNELKNRHINLDGEVVSGNGTAVMRDYIPVMPGQVYTFTKTDSSVPDGGFWRYRWLDENGEYISRRADSRNEFQWTVPDGAYYLHVSYPMDAYPKVEKGNKATDWTPAPEDVEAEINTIKTDVATLTTSYDSITARVESTEGDIDTLTGEITGVKTRTGSLEVRAGSIEASVSAIEEDIDEHGNRLLTVEDAVFDVLPGQIELKANASDVYTKTQVNTELDKKADKTDVDDLTTRVTNAELTINAHEGAIAQKAERSEVYTKTETDAKLGTKVDTTTYNQKVGELVTSIEGISGRVENTETNIDNLTGEIGSVKSDVASLEVRADGIESSVSSLDARVEGNEHQLENHASLIQQNADGILSEVTRLDGKIDGRAVVKPQGGKLWHFDTSLESTDGIKPLEGAVATLRPNEGRFGGAVAVEERTVNLAEASAILNWPGVIQGEDEDGKYYRYTSSSIASVENLFPDVDFKPNTQYTFSFLAKKVSGVRPRFRIFYTDGTYTEIMYNDDVLTYRSVTSVPGKTIQSIRHTHGTSGQNRLYAIQLEEKPYATSFTEGTRPDGILAYPITLKDDYTIACYRKSHTDEDYKHVVKRSDGKVFVDGVEDSEYDVGWIAGRNLILNSDFSDGIKNGDVNWVANIHVISVDTTEQLEGRNSLKVTSPSAGVLNTNRFYTYLPYNRRVNGEATISFYVKGATNNSIQIRTSGTIFSFDITTDWKRLSFTAPATNANDRIVCCLVNAGTAWFNGWKFEKGNKATDWTPAPEDLGYDGDALMLSNQTGLVDELLVLDYEATEEEIQSWYEAKGAFVDQAEINYQQSQIVQLADEISSKVSRDDFDALEGTVTAMGTVVTQTAEAVEQKAELSTVTELADNLSQVTSDVATLTTSYNSISAKVESVEGDIDTLTGDVSDIETRTGSLEIRAGNIEASVSSLGEVIDEHGNRLLTVEHAAFNTLPGQIELKANVDEVYKKGEIDTKLGQKADSTTVGELTTRITSAEQTINAHTGAIAQKAERTEVYTKTETDTKLGTKVDITTYNNKIGELTTSIEGITGRVSSTETSINNLTDEIDSVKTDVSQLEIRADGIESTVTSIDAKVDGIQIGGRNLLRGTDKFDSSAFSSPNSISYVKSGEPPYVEVPANVTSVNLAHIPVKEGEVLTVSVDISMSDTSATGQWLLSQYMIGNTRQDYSWHDPPNKSSLKNDEWMRFAVTLTIPYDCNYSLGLRATNSSSPVRYRRIKIEKGNKATDWTPAPEDVDTEITGVKSRTSTLEQRADGFDAKVQAIEEDVDGLDGRISTAESNISANASAIELRATKSEVQTVNGKVSNLETWKGQFSVTPANINATVSAVNNSSTGLAAAWSEINQTPTRISQAVASLRSDVDDAIADVYSDISQTASSINSTISSLQTNLEGQIAAGDSALSGQITDIEQTLDGITSTVADLGGDLGNISTQVTQLADRYSVKTQKTIGGKTYATGFVSGINEQNESEFAVLADKFRVFGSLNEAGDGTALFVVDAQTKKAYLNVEDVIAAGAIKAEHLEANSLRTHLVEAGFAKFDEANVLDLLEVDGRIRVGNNLEIGENKIVVEGHVETVQTTWITEDTYVDGEGSTKANSNYSNRTSLYFDDGVPLHTLLKFNLPSGRILSATLRLYGWLDDSSPFYIRALKGAWNYQTVTWNNKPASDLVITTPTYQATEGDQWIEIDITPVVQLWKQGQQNHGIEVYYGSDSYAHSSRYSDPAYRPHVVFTVYEEKTPKAVLGDLGGLPWQGGVIPQGTHGLYTVGGYFHGRIEAEEGYFRGDITGATGTFSGELAAKSIKAEWFEEVRNILPYVGTDNIDEYYPIEVDFYIPTETTNIVSIKLSAKALRYRAYARTAAASGSHTHQVVIPAHVHGVSVITNESHGVTGIGGVHDHGSWTGYSSASTSSDGNHTHGYTYYDGDGDPAGGTTGGGGTHSHSVYSHDHSIDNSGAHIHSFDYDNTVPLATTIASNAVTETTEYSESHTHDLVYGIDLDTTPADVQLFCSNDGVNYDSVINLEPTTPPGHDQEEYTLANEKCLTEYFSGTGWKRIKFTSSRRGRITWQLIVKLDITA